MIFIEIVELFCEASDLVGIILGDRIWVTMICSNYESYFISYLPFLKQEF